MSSNSNNLSELSCYLNDIMLDMINTFSTWLLRELNLRGWTQAELARRAGVSRTAISDVISEKHSAGFDLCVAIANAMNLPPETVFRAAGLLPPVAEDTEYQEEVLYLLSQLPPDEQRRYLELLRFEVERQKSKTQSPSRKEKPARSVLIDR